jgi:X-Pro dipeptidyl-peptidase
MRPAVLALLLAAPALAGCLSAPLPDGALDASDAASSWPRGVHPWPLGDGSEWPIGLEGPFAVKEVREVVVPSHDGTPLHGWIAFPEVPAGVRLPAVLVVSPYWGQLYETPDAALFDPRSLDFAAQGYAMAMFSVRGTGHSGGCFQMLGPEEQRDQAWLVTWLASQDWSNGRVGMTGASYDGTTPWEAAIQNPPALKTIVPVASLHDLYTFFHTPQGAPITIGAGFQTAYVGIVSLAPPLLGTPLRAGPEHVPLVPDRACEDVRHTLLSTWQGHVGDARDEAFYAARSLTPRFGGITASVLLAHGFEDRRSFRLGHMQEEDYLWGLLEQAPKRAVLGYWGHEYPTIPDYVDEMDAWFGFWLKGLGSPPRVGTVDYVDNGGSLHSTTAWPPVETRSEVLYLADGALRATPGGDGMTFRSAPAMPDALACAPSSPLGAVFVSEPLAAPALLAGNPFAYLQLASDAPGGLVSVYLYDLAPDACGAGSSLPRKLAMGAADLRFHGGNFAAEPFPIGTPTQVRIELHNLAAAIPAGHRVAVVVSGGNPSDFAPSDASAPAVSVLADGAAQASQIVLPFVEGSLGGAAPTLVYPERPFLRGVSPAE